MFSCQLIVERIIQMELNSSFDNVIDTNDEILYTLSLIVIIMPKLLKKHRLLEVISADVVDNNFAVCISRFSYRLTRIDGRACPWHWLLAKHQLRINLNNEINTLCCA